MILGESLRCMYTVSGFSMMLEVLRACDGQSVVHSVKWHAGC
jgi:hypothetical protein